MAKMLPRGKQSVFYVRISLDIITRCFVDFDTKYSKIEKIGQGAFGEAWKVAPRNDPNQIFVMKEIDTKCIIIFKIKIMSLHAFHRGSGRKEKEYAKNEVTHLMKCQHAHLVGYIDSIVEVTFIMSP